MAQLGDQHGLLKLSHRSQDLTHHGRGGAWIGEVSRRIDRHQVDATSLEKFMASELHDQVAGEPGGVLDQHNAHIMVGTVRQQCAKPRAGVDGVSTAHGGIVEALQDLVPALGICRDSFRLPTLTVFVGTNVCGAGGTEVGDGGWFLAGDNAAPIGLDVHIHKQSPDCLELDCALPHLPESVRRIRCALGHEPDHRLGHGHERGVVA